MDDNNDSPQLKEELSTVNLSERPESGLRRKLYIIIFEADTQLGRLFDIVLLWAILISVLQVIIESDPRISANFGQLLSVSEWILTIFFTVEYILRLYVSKYPSHYAKSFFGIVDILSILPTYIGLFFPGTHYLMVVRALRLLRIFRILKLARFMSASRTLGVALAASRYKILIFMGVILSLVLIMGTCMYIVEGEQNGFDSIPRSMYWAIVTMTTVGYGDIVPHTSLGKFVASIMMLIGYAIIAVPTGIVTSELNSVNNKEKSDDQTCQKCFTEVLITANYCHKCGEQIKL